MQSLFATPGMVAMSVMVFSVQAVSLLVCWVVLREFRHVVRKYESMLCRMTHRSGENSCCFFTPNVAIVWIYFGLTIVLTLGTMTYFFWQPHLI